MWTAFSTFPEQSSQNCVGTMSNPFGIPDTTTTDFDYSKLSPMLGMIDNDSPDYIGGNTSKKTWYDRVMHNCAVVYLGGSYFFELLDY